MVRTDRDFINNAFIHMDEIHANIHRGWMFSASIVDLALADDAAIEVLIQTHATQSAHMRFVAAGGGDVEIELYEGATFSAAGTPMSASNRNRSSANTADSIITHTPTLTGDGTELHNTLGPGGSGFFATPGGESRTFEEWVLAPATVYLFRVSNRSGVAAPVSVTLDFYEPEVDD